MLTVASPVHAESQAAIFSIPVDRAAFSADTRFVPDEPLQLALVAEDPSRLQAVLASRGASLGTDGRVRVTLGPYRPVHFEGEHDWRAATFFVDYADSPVPELVNQLRASKGEPSPSDIVEFVSDVVQGTHDRGFDLASQVARNLRGDCTEYAVLTTALARASGYPARVVLGVAVSTRDGEVAAYGHAWSEISVAGKWQLADAALVRLAASIRYLPLGVLDNEGPGYAISLMQLMPAWVKLVTILPPPG